MLLLQTRPGGMGRFRLIFGQALLLIGARTSSHTDLSGVNSLPRGCAGNLQACQEK